VAFIIFEDVNCKSLSKMFVALWPLIVVYHLSLMRLWTVYHHMYISYKILTKKFKEQ